MNIKTIQISHLYLGFIFGFGLFLRFYFNSDFSLSNDELSAVNRLNFSSLSQLINEGIKIDGHPAGAQLLIYYWTKVFGLNPFQIRFPFILLSSLTPIFAYLFMRKASGETQGLIFAVFVSFLEFPFLYSLIARPYGPGLTIILAAAWLWHSLLFEPKNKYSILKVISLGIVWSMAIYFHYFAGLTALIMGFTGLLYLKRNNVIPYLSAALIAIILFIPHLTVTFYQLSLKGVGSWLGKPNSDWIIDHLFYFLNSSYFTLTGIGILLILLIIKSKKLIKEQYIKSVIFAFWFLIPYLIGYYYSIKVDAVLQNSVLIFSTPFLIAAVLSLVNLEFNKYGKTTIILIFLLLISELLIISPMQTRDKFADFKTSAKNLISWQKKHPNIKHYLQINHPNYILFYQPELKNISEQKSYRTDEELLKFAMQIQNTENEYLSFTDLKKEANQICFDLLNSKFGQPISIYKNGLLATTYLYKCEEIVHKNEDKTIEIDSVEFMGIFEQNISFSKSDTLKVNAIYSIESPPETGHLTISIEDQKNNVVHWETTPLKYFNIEDKANIYIKVQRKINLNKGNYRIKVYILNPEKEKLSIRYKRATIK